MYTPRFSDVACVSIRRLAWAMGINMVKTIEAIVKLLPTIVSSSKVCGVCKDKTKCQVCIFYKAVDPQEFSIFEPVI